MSKFLRNPKWFSKHKALTALVALLTIFAIVGVLNSSSNSVNPLNTGENLSVAGKLAQYDLGGKIPDTTIVAQYQAALDLLKPRCREDEATLSGEIYASQLDLKNNKINDETNLTLMGHIRDAIPAGLAPMDCKSIMASYLVLREPQ